MAIFFSTWVKIGKAGGPDLKKNLENLISNSTSALRIECLKENGKKVFYIRDRNIFDYFWENLDAYESQLRDMRTRARVALELDIRSFIQDEVVEVVEGRKSLPLWKKLEQRILEDGCLTKSKRTFYNLSECLLGRESTVDELASIPDGLSLAKLPPSAFIAGVSFGFKDGKDLKANKPMHVGFSQRHMVDWPPATKMQLHAAAQIKQFYLNALNELQSKNLTAFSSIVITPTPHPFETDGKLSDQHAQGFLMAAKEFMEKRKELQKPVSLLIAVENEEWHEKLQIEMLAIKLDSLRPKSNFFQGNQLDDHGSPQGFDSVSKLWDRSCRDNTLVAPRIDLDAISDDEIFM